MGRDTLRKALTDAGHKLTGDRVKFSTRTIHEALSRRGGLEAAREAETWERHRQLKLENEKEEGTHWHRDDCLAYIARRLQPIRQRIISRATRMAATANPTDPEHAHRVLTEDADSELRLFSQPEPEVQQPKNDEEADTTGD